MKLSIFSLSTLLLMTTLWACKSKVSQNTEKYRSVDVPTAKQLLAADSDIIILDVRTPGEVAAGHIKGALKIDVMNDSFVSEIAKLDKDKTYLVYCKSGGRSVTASNTMLENGFQDVINMEGGYTAWDKN